MPRVQDTIDYLAGKEDGPKPAQSECAWCGEEGFEFTCPDCRGWDAYWDSLTPAQRRAEIAMMDAHGGER